jgi:hypothetical protein
VTTTAFDGVTRAGSSWLAQVKVCGRVISLGHWPTETERGSVVLGVVDRDGGATRAVAEACVVIPTVAPEWITQHPEGLCAVLWPLPVSHRALERAATK